MAQIREVRLVADLDGEEFAPELQRSLVETNTPVCHTLDELRGNLQRLRGRLALVALHLGAQDLVLVGCDSNYASSGGSYFYPAEGHASATTDEAQLVRTWTPDGAGQHGYRRYAEELVARGVRLRDATVGGALTVLPRIELHDVRSLLPAATQVGFAAE